MVNSNALPRVCSFLAPSRFRKCKRQVVKEAAVNLRFQLVRQDAGGL
jgi:hypothetical protein